MWTDRADVSYSLSRIDNSNNFAVGLEERTSITVFEVARARIASDGGVEFIKGLGGDNYDFKNNSVAEYVPPVDATTQRV